MSNFLIHRTCKECNWESNNIFTYSANIPQLRVIRQYLQEAENTCPVCNNTHLGFKMDKD